MMRPKKLERLSLETLSSQVLEFEGKARANPIGMFSGASFLAKPLVLPANVRLDWKAIARYKHSSLFSLVVSNKGNKFYNIETRPAPSSSAAGPTPWSSLTSMSQTSKLDTQTLQTLRS